VRTSLKRAADIFRNDLTGSPAQEYLAGRGVTPDAAAAHRLGFVAGHAGIDPLYSRYVGRLAVPNLNADGVVVQIKFRALDPDAEKKYDQLSLPQRLFNLQAVKQSDGSRIALCEGEFDVITCTTLGIPAVGIPGADSWEAHHVRIFSGFDEVVMFAHDDKAGHNLLRKVMGSGLPVKPAKAPGSHADLNDALQEGLGDEIRKAYLG